MPAPCLGCGRPGPGQTGAARPEDGSGAGAERHGAGRTGGASRGEAGLAAHDARPRPRHPRQGAGTGPADHPRRRGRQQVMADSRMGRTASATSRSGQRTRQAVRGAARAPAPHAGLAWSGSLTVLGVEVTTTVARCRPCLHRPHGVPDKRQARGIDASRVTTACQWCSVG